MKSLLWSFVLCATIPALGAGLDFLYTDSCEAVLAAEGAGYEQQMEAIFSGSGQVRVFTPGDFAGPGAPKLLRQALLNYQGLNARGHRALFYLLPPTANHAFGTLASTYLDNPTSHFKTSADKRWFAFEAPEAGSRSPLHKVVFRSDATDISIVHETFHLQDLEEVFVFVENRVPRDHRLIIRQDIFRFVTELIVYKKTFRHFSEREDSRIQSELDVRGMKSDFIPHLKNLDDNLRLPLLQAFAIDSLSDSGLKQFLTDKNEIPKFMDVIAKLSADAVRVVKK